MAEVDIFYSTVTLTFDPETSEMGLAGDKVTQGDNQPP